MGNNIIYNKEAIMKTKNAATIRTLLAIVIAAAMAFAATQDVSAVTRAKTESQETTDSQTAEESDSNSKSSSSSKSSKSTTDSNSSKNKDSQASDETVTDGAETADGQSEDADADSSSSSKKTATASGSSKKTTTSSGSSKKTTASSSDSDGYKVLLTDKQRANKFKSKTNPKMGATPITLPRPASAGFSYADFAKYNDYNSDNHLGGTPIYLLGTVMDVQPVKEGDSDYKAAVMVNDCDGYQWYVRVNCSKAKYDLMKNEILGKAGYIYGTYAGYSGVTNRPMMDMMIMIETPGNAVNMSLYR